MTIYAVVDCGSRSIAQAEAPPLPSRMSHELFHVFGHTDGQDFFDGREIIEELREGAAVLEMVEQRPNWYTRAHKHGRSPENVKI